jgi:hypothetical protein
VNTPGEEANGLCGDAEFDAEARADALDVLNDLLEWQLAPQRWERVEQIVDSIVEALAAGDVDALREATAELELAGPVRITRIGSTPLLPAPEQVRDRANHLVHSLGGAPREPSAGPATTSELGDGGDRNPAG